MGLAGAALASGIGQCLGGFIPLFYILRAKNLPLQFTRFRFDFRPILKTCANGSSEFMSNISTSFVSMLYNIQLLRLLGENGISAYGVLMYVQLIFIGTSIGYSIGSAPIISFHYGANHHDELKNMLRKSLTLMLISGVILTGLALGLSSALAKLFVGYDAELCRADPTCVLHLLVLLPADRAEYLLLQLFHRTEQRAHLRRDFVRPNASLPIVMRPDSAGTVRRGRHLVCNDCSRSTGVCGFLCVHLCKAETLSLRLKKGA